MSVTRSYKTVTFSKFEADVLLSVLIASRDALVEKDCKSLSEKQDIAKVVEVIEAAVGRMVMA